MKLSEFDFFLPPDRIAQSPAPIRDQSGLMIIDRKSGRIGEGQFKDIIRYLYPDDLIVLNNTRVFPARLLGEKEKTGGKIEALLVQPLSETLWVCLIKGKVCSGQRLIFAQGQLSGFVEGKERDGGYKIRFEWAGNFSELLEKHGQIPLPPYIKRKQPLPQDHVRYQTVFARHMGAVAAPTAGLHFTQNLINQIKQKGVKMAYVTLHVGPGTFKPIREDAIERHKMDQEAYFIRPQDLQVIIQTKDKGKRVIAVGTTTTRVLETIYQGPLPRAPFKTMEGWTGLYITPGFRFQVVDALITNFHLPRSTLLILVCAFGGYNLMMKAYRTAIQKHYRFYSYGDAMLIT